MNKPQWASKIRSDQLIYPTVPISVTIQSGLSPCSHGDISESLLTLISSPLAVGQLGSTTATEGRETQLGVLF